MVAKAGLHSGDQEGGHPVIRTLYDHVEEVSALEVSGVIRFVWFTCNFYRYDFLLLFLLSFIQVMIRSCWHQAPGIAPSKCLTTPNLLPKRP